MNILLDECVPWPLHKMLRGHICKTAQQMGWCGLKNGDLLAQAEFHFDLFVTSDQNIRYQQNLVGRRLPIIELSTNNLRRIVAAESLLLETVSDISTGQYRRLEIP